MYIALAESNIEGTYYGRGDYETADYGTANYGTADYGTANYGTAYYGRTGGAVDHGRAGDRRTGKIILLQLLSLQYKVELENINIAEKLRLDPPFEIFPNAELQRAKTNRIYFNVLCIVLIFFIY